MKHFIYYPKIEYSNETSVNITVRARIKEAVLQKSAITYDYVIRENDTPESISTKYYGNPNFVWCIYYTNNIFNPIFDWSLSSKNFIKFIEKKYGSLSLAQNVNNIVQYEYLDIDSKKTFIIDKLTYESYLNQDDKKNFVKPVTAFDYEFRVNEMKKFIKILDKNDLSRITNELKNIFK
jgi:hypothetical protein